MVGIFSKGILKTVPWLEELLGHKVILNPRTLDGLIAVAGWGHKTTAKKAMQKAKEWDLPFLGSGRGFYKVHRSRRTYVFAYSRPGRYILQRKPAFPA